MVLLWYESRHTKGEPWNSIMKAAAPTYRQVPKTTASPPPYPSLFSYLFCKTNGITLDTGVALPCDGDLSTRTCKNTLMYQHYSYLSAIENIW